MRNAIAIFLLLIYVYNLIGYKAVFSYLEQKATTSLVSKLDKGQYSDDELLEIKIPYNSLYSPSLNEYVRYDGNIEIDGHHYSYVKRKFLNDTLYLLCIPNEANTNLASAKLTYYDNSTDNDGTTPDKSKAPSSGNAKSFSSDYNFSLNSFEFKLPQRINHSYFIAGSGKLPASFISSLYKPPRLMA